MVSPHTFTWERYIGVIGYSTQDVWNIDKNCPMPGFVELGRVDARSIPMRPRDGIAVMLEDENGERFWLHIYNVD